MGSIRAQLRQVLRRLARAPMFAAITLLTLGVGIGANTAVFTVLESVLLQPLPYARPGELVGVLHAAPAMNIPELGMSPSNYFIYREEGRAWSDVGIYHGDSVSVTGAGDPEQVRALGVTDGVLPILAVTPLLGRTFTRADDLPGSPATVMVTHGYWQRRLSADPAVVGRTLTVDGKPREIVGVLPPKFQFLDWEEFGIGLPMQLNRAEVTLGNFSYQGLARLAPGKSIADANAEVARLLPVVMRSFPTPPGFSLELFQKAEIAANVRPLLRDVVGDVGKVLWILMASIGLVLLIACANVANLLIVRAEGRQQELAVRAALGASRGRLAGELLFESLIIGLLGSVVGLAFAYGALEILLAIAPTGLPRLGEIRIGLPAILFTLGASLFASLLFGCVPILKYSRAGMAIREGGRSVSEGRERHRARNVLVVVQVALAFVLLCGSGLMIRSFHALTRVDPGFTDPASVQTFRISIPEARIADPVKVMRAEEEILRKIAAIPGVTSAALTNGVPMADYNWHDPVFAEDRTYAAGELPPLRRFRFISPELLTTLGIPLVAGRTFTWEDMYDDRPVALVSQNLAREYWQDPANALGKRVRVSSTGPWREVVGVVGDVHEDGVNKEASSIAYWPLLTKSFDGSKLDVRRDVSVVIRSPRAGAESLMKEVRPAVWSVDASLPLANVYTLDHYTKRSIARTAFTLVMLGLAGGMALLLGTVGLYGVIAYSVSRRTREIGIRMALGAQEKALTGMFIRQGLWLTLAGVTAGLVAAGAGMRLLSSVLFQVRPIDPLTYAAVFIGLVSTAALASYLPSRRAATVDPVEAMRSE
jgi:predicted permease